MLSVCFVLLTVESLWFVTYVSGERLLLCCGTNWFYVMNVMTEQLESSLILMQRLQALPHELVVHEIVPHLSVKKLVQLINYRLWDDQRLLCAILVAKTNHLTFSERRTALLDVCWLGKAVARAVGELALKRPELFDLYGMHALATHLMHRGLPNYTTLLKNRWNDQTGLKVGDPWFSIRAVDFKLIGKILIAERISDAKTFEQHLKQLYRTFYATANEIELRLLQLTPVSNLRDQQYMWIEGRRAKYPANKHISGHYNRLNAIKCRNSCWRVYGDPNLWPIRSNGPNYLGTLNTEKTLSTLTSHSQMFHLDPPAFLVRKLTPVQLKELRLYALKYGLTGWVEFLSSPK